MSVLKQILHFKIIAIIRGANPEDVPHIAQALFEGGIRLFEVTLNSEKPYQSINKTKKLLSDEVLVGAGTVLDPLQVQKAAEAGAQFILSPVLDLEVMEETKKRGMVSIPGAYTPTEIYTAFKKGADLVKVFPAGQPSYLKDLRGPLPQIPLVPTGGISLENIKAFLDAGAVAFGIGSSLVHTKEKVTESYLIQLKDKAAAFVKALESNP